MAEHAHVLKLIKAWRSITQPKSYAELVCHLAARLGLYQQLGAAPPTVYWPLPEIHNTRTPTTNLTYESTLGLPTKRDWASTSSSAPRPRRYLGFYQKYVTPAHLLLT